MFGIKQAIKKYLKDVECARVARTCNFDPLDNFVIFGDPRGGSTWVTELIHTLPNTAIVWEPLHLDFLEPFKDLGFAWRQFIPESEAWPEAREVFETVFRGRLLNSWLCSLSFPQEVKQAHRLIVKFCRGNGMIPWLTQNFKFKYDPLYLVRHPFSVVASQMNYGPWDEAFTGFEIPKGPFNDPYLEHADYLKSLETKEEALVATWAITNNVPLKHPENDKKWITVYYETLIEHPEKELGRILDRWQIESRDDILSKVRKASVTTKENTAEVKKENQLSKWKRYFNSEQEKRMLEVLTYFEITEYSSDTHPSPIS